MRIGIVWTGTPRLALTTVRFERYLEGFEALGHEAVIVSTKEAAAGYPWAGVTVSGLDELRRPALWAGLRLDKDRNNALTGVAGVITADGSSMPAYVIPTDEELLIARDTVEIVLGQPKSPTE